MQPQYTHRSQAALAAAQELAVQSGHPELTPAHLASALLVEPEGVTSAVLDRLGVDPRTLQRELDELLQRLPRTSGGQVSGSRALAEVIAAANAAAGKRGDEYVSTEHLLLALASKGSPEVAALFSSRDAGPTSAFPSSPPQGAGPPFRPSSPSGRAGKALAPRVWSPPMGFPPRSRLPRRPSRHRPVLSRKDQPPC